MQPLSVEQSFWERFRDWEYEWTPIRNWFANTWTYHAETHGMVGMIGFALVILAILLSFRATRVPLVFLFDVIVRQSLMTLVTGFWIVLAGSMRWLSSQVFVRLRYAVRNIHALVRSRP